MLRELSAMVEGTGGRDTAAGTRTTESQMDGTGTEAKPGTAMSKAITQKDGM